MNSRGLKNIHVTTRKSISLGTPSIDWNSASIVVKRTVGTSTAGAVNADADADADADTDANTGLDPDANAGTNPVIGAPGWI